MKIRTALIAVALMAMLVITACAVKDKVMDLTNVVVNGNAAEFVKVVDGAHTLKKVDGGLELTLKAELLKELIGINPDSLQIGNWNLTFKNAEGIAVAGMESVPLKEDLKAGIINMMKGLVGDKMDLTFMQMIDDKNVIKSVLKEAASFELNTELLNMEAAMMVPAEEVVVKEPAPVAGVTPTPVKPKPPVVKPPAPPKPPTPSQDWDKKLGEYETAVDRYLAMRSQNPTRPAEVKRLTDQRAKVQNLASELAAAPDMTAAQKARFNRIKAKMD